MITKSLHHALLHFLGKADVGNSDGEEEEGRGLLHPWEGELREMNKKQRGWGDGDKKKGDRKMGDRERGIGG